MFGFASLGELAFGEVPTAPAAPTPKDNAFGPPHAFGQYALGQEDDGGGITTTLTVEAASVTVTGQSIAFRADLAVGAATLEASGQSVPLAKPIPVEAGAIEVTGRDQTFTIGLAPVAGALEITGQDVTVSVLVPTTARAALFRSSAARGGKPKFYWKGRSN